MSRSDNSNVFFPNRLINQKTIHELLDLLYQADHKMLLKGHFDDIVERCIHYAGQFNDREIFKRLAFVLFSGPRINDGFSYKMLLKHQWGLIFLLSDEKSHLSDITFVLRNCFEIWKQITTERDLEIGQLSQSTETFKQWNGYDVSPEDEVLITHGGGWYHIQAFLQGKTLGYRLQGKGIGLQVHTTSNDRSLHYANKNWLHLDEPAVLIATIKAKYLCRQYNSYEVGLRSEVITHLEDVKVVRMKHFWLGNGFEEVIREGFYPDNPELEERIRESLQRFEKAKDSNREEQMELWKLNFPADAQASSAPSFGMAR